MEKKKIAITEYFERIKTFKINGKIKALLKELMATEPSRYSIDMVKVVKDKLMVTDGRRCLILRAEHKISPGLYFMTSEGFLLHAKGSGFPSLKDVLPEKVDDSLVLGDPYFVFSLVLREASKSGAFSVELYSSFIEKANKLGPEEISWKMTKEGALYITGSLSETESAIFEYVQMPINTDTESVSKPVSKSDKPKK